MQIPFSPPDIGQDEIDEVVDTLRSGWITTGPKTKLFEKKICEYIGCDCAVCLNSATAALELTLRVLGIGEGDEVITSAYTYTASASVIVHVGATPVLVDCAKDSFEMDYQKLESAITERTKAIIPVDLAGVICDYDKIYSAVLNKKHLFNPKTELQKKLARIAVVTDAAHAFGASQKGKKCGQISDFTCFSFHAVKNLTTAEGGAVVFNNTDSIQCDKLYKEYQLLSLHGQSKDALAKTRLGAWEYDIVAPNYKCNMTDIMASIGLAQLRRYDKMLSRRHEIARQYNKLCRDIGADFIVHSGADFTSSAHLYLMRPGGFDEQRRNRFIVDMAEKGVATNVHYKPLPMLSAYKNLGFDIKDFKNAYDMYKNEVTLPLHTSLTDEQVSYITECVKACL